MKQEYRFTINGHKVHAVYQTAFIEETIRPLIQKWRTMAMEEKRRIIVFLAAPPAVGKSTLAALFETIGKEDSDQPTLQSLGMDGFHHYQSYILKHTVNIQGQMVPMKSVKGCPESFDYERFYDLIQKAKQQDTLLWPYYNRKLHDVEDDQIEVNAQILLIEGNYLLLDEAPWNQLSSLCDDSIFISTSTDAVKKRLIQRKVMGGSLPHEAVSFYENSDKKNVERVLDHRLPAHLDLYFDGETYHAVN